MAKDLFSDEFTAPPYLSKDLKEKIKSSEPMEELEFDSLLPPLYRFLSPVQWTSIEVARKIAEWLADHPSKKFIDIGCGVGKLCILLNILTDLNLYGIEQRPHLLKVGQTFVDTNQLQNIQFQEMNLIDVNWADYDIFYLYNPFQEHLCTSDALIIDNSIELSATNFSQYKKHVQKELKAAAPGKVLITFHGFGGAVPRSWNLQYSQFVDGGFLSMWVKAKP